MRLLFAFFLLLNCSISFSQEERRNTLQNDFLLAENYYRQGEYEKATQLYKKLYTKSPFNTTYLGRLISCYQETSLFNKAETLLKERISSNPNQSYLYVYLGQNYNKQQKKEQAKLYFDKAIKSLDKNTSYAGIIGRLFKQYNLLDLAIESYRKAMLKNENVNYNFQIAQIYGEKGDFTKMFDAFIDLVDQNKNYYNLVQRYASRYITDDAENEINISFRKSLLKKSASNPKDVWNLLLSWLFAQQQDYLKAFIQEKALYQRTPEDLSGIFSLGKIALENKDYAAAKICFNFINENTSIIEDKIDANWYLTKIAIATKDAKTEILFENLFSSYGKNISTIKLQTEYADYLTFVKNKPNQAKKVLEEALNYAKSKFDKARIKLKLGDVLVFTGKFNKALIYFSQVQTQLKNSNLAQQARFKVAQTSYFKGDFTWAKAQLKVLKSSTSQLIANDAVDLFLLISDNEPLDSVPSGLKEYAQADVLAYQNKNKEAIDVLLSILENGTLKEINGGFLPITNNVHFKLADLYIKEEELQKAIRNLVQIVKNDKQSYLIDDVYYKLAELYNYQLKDTEKAKEYYQKIIFEQPSSIYLVDARKKFRRLRGDTL